MALSNPSTLPVFASCLLMALLLSAPIAHATTYELQAGLSEIVIKVYKGGAFKALGHSHIISTRDVTGTINWNKTNLQETDFELVIPVDSFRVDDPELRRQAGKAFTKDVDDSARKGTRKNMLGEKVLDVSRFPKINVRSKSIKQRKTSELDVAIELKIHGISRTVTVPVVFYSIADSISIKGKFSLLQSDYGIKPLSAAFGSIVVKDRIDIHFLLVVRKIAR
jgi:polyisoprenoid-binding protein YceI